mgnify:CR=1 FL=1
MNKPPHIATVMADNVLNRIPVERVWLLEWCWSSTDGILSAPDEIAVLSISRTKITGTVFVALVLEINVTSP